LGDLRRCRGLRLGNSFRFFRIHIWGVEFAEIEGREIVNRGCWQIEVAQIYAARIPSRPASITFARLQRRFWCDIFGLLFSSLLSILSLDLTLYFLFIFLFGFSLTGPRIPGIVQSLNKIDFLLFRISLMHPLLKIVNIYIV
jgi:hypothetical protein